MYKLFNMLVLLGLIFGCGSDYSAPGRYGALPDSLIEAEPNLQVNVEKGGVANLPCTPPYKIAVIIKEKNCGPGFNFTPLYNQATAIANKRIGELQCPTTVCNIKTPIIRLQKWQCDSTFNLAVLSVQWQIHCLSSTSPAPATLPVPTPAQLLTAPFEAPAGTPIIDAAILDADEVFRGITESPAGCPGRHLRLVNYYEKVAPGTTITDYEPYVKRAEDRARAFYESLSCAPPCTKKEIYTIIFREWGRVQNGVNIRIAFSFQCNP